MLAGGVILEGELGEKVSLSWLTSSRYLELREKWKCTEYIEKSKIWTKTSPWNPEIVAKRLPLKALGWPLQLILTKPQPSCISLLHTKNVAKMPYQNEYHNKPKQCRPRSYATECSIWSGSKLFVIPGFKFNFFDSLLKLASGIIFYLLNLSANLLFHTYKHC